MIVRYTTQALLDIAGIRRYIAADSPSAALRVAFDLFGACDALADFPRQGRPGRRVGTRELLTVPPYVIVYRLRADEVEIDSVWHAAQDRRSGD